jgi:HNH endonuclease
MEFLKALNDMPQPLRDLAASLKAQGKPVLLAEMVNWEAVQRKTNAQKRTLIQDVSSFWSRVDIQSINECWPVLGQNSEDYPRFKLGDRRYSAHEIAFITTNGTIPPDLIVCHSCDFTRCSNPTHLWLGTYKENTQDMLTKNRTNPVRGSNAHNSKLTESAVIEIRELYANGTPQAKLCKQFGVFRTTLQKAITGVTWKHI